MAQQEEKADESTSSRRPQAKATKPNPAPEPEEMATVAMDISKPPPAASGDESAKGARAGGEGLRQYYLQHIHDLQLQIRTKTHNLNRLEAQRNDLNSKGQTLLLDPSPGVRVSPEP
jgi:hypothetical protein